ncbi:MAG: proprotein convertase P-domain-containing protein [Saprospiraceae bacterium]|nr:proprotein convertase P-domain-containing protein [Saprospiraceae bacterium]
MKKTGSTLTTLNLSPRFQKNITITRPILFCLLLFLSLTPPIFGQNLLPLEEIDLIVLPRQDNQALLEEELKNRQVGTAPKFAISFPVAISPLKRGNWEEQDDGTAVWRLRILSPAAHSLNLGFGEFFLPPGAELDLYSTDQKNKLGPFTPNDNDDHREFWTPIIEGDEMVVELRLPKEQRKNLSLKITSINHDFLGFSTFVSGSCNLDVICSAVDGWDIVDAYRDIIQSVGVYSTGGSTFCTGFLVNNTLEDCTPFFMTADHCGMRANNAASLVVYWNFQNANCRAPNSGSSGGPGNGALNDFNSGSVLRARSGDTDFGLLELDDPVSPTAEAFFAGWDARPEIPVDTVIAIHHPNTDEKRISFSFEQVYKGNLNGQGMANGGYLVVPEWSIGTTEGGSSGCPLFDQNRRVVGQLFGGAASCNNLDYDAFGWFAVSWEGGGTPDTRLRDWLDPENTGKITLDGRTQNACNFRILADEEEFLLCDPSELVFDLGPSDNFTAPVALSIVNLPDGITAAFEGNPVVAGETTTVRLEQLAQLAPGTYSFDINGTDGTESASTTITLVISENLPTATTLTSPVDEAENTGTAPNFTWSAIDNAITYIWQLSTSDDFFSVVASEEDLVAPEVSYNNLATETTYFWRARAVNACGSGDWSPVFSFTTAGVYCLITDSDDIPVTIGSNNPNTVSSDLLVEQEGLVASISVSMDIKHTYVSDLVANLISPNGTSISLFRNPGENVTFQGCSRDDLILSFNDDAPQGNDLLSSSCDNATPTISGVFQPQQALAELNGEDAQGTWTLEIIDEFSEDGGTIDSWSLEICTSFSESAVLSTSTPGISVCPGESFEFDLIIGGGFSDEGLTVNTNELPEGASLELDPMTPTAASTVTVSGSGFDQSGDYPITFTASDGTASANTTVDIEIRSVPDNIIPLQPQDGAELVSIAPTFSWTTNPGADNYRVTVSTSPDLSNPVVDLNTGNNIINLGDLARGQTYYWQISATNDCGLGQSDVWTFSTIPDLSFVTDPSSIIVCPEDEPSFSFVLDEDFLGPVDLSFSSQPDSGIGLERDGGLNDLTPGETININLNAAGVPAGDYQLELSLDDGTLNTSTSLTVQILDAPIAPNLTSPADQSSLAVLPDQLSWEAVPNISEYQIEIAGNANFDPILESGQTTGNNYMLNTITEGGTYFWRVSSSNACGLAASTVFQFTFMPNAVNEIDGNRINIFPNPTLAEVQVNFTRPIDQQLLLQVHHVNGKLLFQRQLQAGQQQENISLADVPAGVYLLSLQTATDKLIRKIIKQ